MNEKRRLCFESFANWCFKQRTNAALIEQQRSERLQRIERKEKRKSTGQINCGKRTKENQTSDIQMEVRKSERIGDKKTNYPIEPETKFIYREISGSSKKDLTVDSGTKIMRISYERNHKGKEMATYQLSDNRYVTEEVLRSMFKTKTNTMIGDFIEESIDPNDPFAEWSSDEVRDDRSCNYIY